MGMFGSLKSKTVDPEYASKLSFGDRARLFAVALDDPGAAFQMKQQMQIKPAQDDFMADFAKKLAPQYAETQGAGAAVASGGDYQWSPPVRTSDGLNINSPDLPAIAFQARRLGVPLTEVLDVMKAQQPSWQAGPDGNYINTRGSRAPRAAAVNGIRPTADGRAEAVGGYADALAGIETAKVMGQEGAKAAYDLIDVPDGRGGTIKMPRAAVLQAAAQGGTYGKPGGIGYTPPAAQLSGDKIRADAAANADVERPGKLANLDGQIKTLDSMEALLPNVIAGFGSDALLQLARVKAATGDKQAQAKVTATETFLNQGRQLVATVIKQFGANPTEGERKYAEKMSGADAELNPATLREGIRLARERNARERQAVMRGPGGGQSAGPTGPRTTGARGSRIISVE